MMKEAGKANALQTHALGQGTTETNEECENELHDERSEEMGQANAPQTHALVQGTTETNKDCENELNDERWQDKRASRLSKDLERTT